jgi:hypothetical protein
MRETNVVYAMHSDRLTKPVYTNNMDRQQRVMQNIAKLKAGSHKNLTSRQISKQLRKLYDPWVFDGLRFYTQDSDGCPLVKAETNIAGVTQDCTVAFMNEMILTDWRSQDKPETFGELPWPPRQLADLLGCTSTEDICVQCAFKEQKILVGEEYLDWAAAMYNFWLDNIRLCDIPKVKGYGLRARNAITKNTIIGEYTGEVIPTDQGISDEENQYNCEIEIGPPGTKEKTQALGWIDATTRGSIFRFMNHSCNSNTMFMQGRCGLHNRIIYVITTEDIQKDEEITVDYGDGWWENMEMPCVCGSKNCIKPPTDVDKSGKPEIQPKKEKRGIARVIKRGKPAKNKQILRKSTTLLPETRDSSRREQVSPLRPDSPTTRQSTALLLETQDSSRREQGSPMRPNSPANRSASRPAVFDHFNDKTEIPRKKGRLSRESDKEDDYPERRNENAVNQMTR